ncbi:glycogen debranching enzyme [Pseudoxanthomonas winnipegensis]|uniref:Glycogen debranching enzyme n=1 Tax=Pseudoxanthomonas winnipegensis TaxID=2480810 RepID=A0AAW8G8E5_9GAMM|nr:glycogen debranching enzyme [Pseudoxanthomonas winnipegensis]MDQ1135120.1 glycogen debranching enzyme [Pseudoxanthomonas winnipegensis]
MALRSVSAVVLSMAATVCLLAEGSRAATQADAAAPRDDAGVPSWTVTAPVQERYLAAHGLRGFAGGYGSDGLEVWSFPVQIASGYRLEFLRGDGTRWEAADAPAAATVDPFGLTRVYAAPGLRVSERIEARDTLPGVRVRLRVEQAPTGLRIRVHLVPSLNLMWPAGIGGQEFGWDDAAKGLLLQEPSGAFRALVASPQAGAHSVPNNDRRGSAFGQPLFLDLLPSACGRARCATLAFAAQSERDEDVYATAAALLEAPEAPAAADAARYAQATRLRIATPDAQADRALRWAQVALEQAWSCNPRLGCGLVAGYGPSHGARRPQYAWYFGGDGLVTTRALIASGQFERAAAQLAFELRYQHPDNGMLWHELSQSAGFLQWVRDYPHMYAHVDIAFDFLSVTAEYARASGDDAFLRAHWPQLLAAWRYCRGLIDAGDGLPRVPAGKMSGNEQDALTDELTLSAAWVDAAQAMAVMADTQGEAALAAQARADAVRARAAIRARYRDPAGQWISGFHRDGRPGERFSGADLAAIGSGAATPQEAAAIFAQLASPDVLTDWGLRSKPASAPDYEPQAYSRGSVWGLGSAGAAEAMWRAGRGAQAADLWQRLVPWAAQDAPGHMHEVQSGAAFVPQRESVPEQTWSSASFLSAAIGGLLGLEVDGARRRLAFAPQPPAEWDWLRVQGVRVGADGGTVDLAWRREAHRAVLELDNHGQAFDLTWRQLGGDAAPPTLERRIGPGRTRLVLPWSEE